MLLEAVNLSKSFGERTLFSSASFRLEAGEKIGIIGANGSGKTTLFSIISGAEEPSSGGIVKAKGVSIGYLSQHACKDSKRSVYDEALQIFAPLIELEAELEEKERARQAAEAAAKAAENEVKYTSKVAKLIFRGSVDPSITKRIHEIILATIKYYHKEDVYIKIKATIPDYNSINLEFVKIPENEIPLLVNIIKVLGRSDLGIIKATLD